jgi:hypothetical protein
MKNGSGANAENVFRDCCRLPEILCYWLPEILLSRFKGCTERRELSFLSAPNSTEGYPTWQQRTHYESRAYFRLQIHRIFKERFIAGLFAAGSVEIKCITAGKNVRLQ